MSFVPFTHRNSQKDGRCTLRRTGVAEPSHGHAALPMDEENAAAAKLQSVKRGQCARSGAS